MSQIDSTNTGMRKTWTLHGGLCTSANPSTSACVHLEAKSDPGTLHVEDGTFVWQVLESVWDETPVEASNAVPLQHLLCHGQGPQCPRALQLDLPPAGMDTSAKSEGWKGSRGHAQTNVYHTTSGSILPFHKAEDSKMH